MAHFSSALLTEAITAPDKVKLDFRTFAWLGNVSEDVRVCYVRSATGIHKWPDMVASALVVFGATAPGTAGNVDTAMLRNLFGIKLKQVQGYAGSADKRIAIERGEIDGDCGGWTSVPEDWLRERQDQRHHPAVADAGAGHGRDIPWGGDLVTQRRRAADLRFPGGARAARPPVHGGGRVPAERIAALRTGLRCHGGRP